MCINKNGTNGVSRGCKRGARKRPFQHLHAMGNLFSCLDIASVRGNKGCNNNYGGGQQNITRESFNNHGSGSQSFNNARINNRSNN